MNVVLCARLRVLRDLALLSELARARQRKVRGPRECNYYEVAQHAAVL